MSTKIRPNLQVRAGADGTVLKSAGGVADWSALVAADITPGVNGQTLQTVGGVSVWAAPAIPSEVEVVASLPGSGVADTIYVDTSSNLAYIWDGAAFQQISPSAAPVSLTLAGNTGTQTIVNNDTITVAGAGKIKTTAAATDTITVEIDTAGATSGQQLTFDGTGVVWGSASTPLAANGLNIESGVVELGGALNENTTITTGNAGTGYYLRVDNTDDPTKYAQFEQGTNDNTTLKFIDADSTTIIEGVGVQVNDSSLPLTATLQSDGTTFTGAELSSTFQNDEFSTKIVAGQNSTVIRAIRVSGTDPVGIVLRGSSTVDANLHLKQIDLTGTATSGLGINAAGKVISYAIPAASTVTREDFDPAAAATTVTVANTPTAAHPVEVFRNGLLQREGALHDYTVSGSVITFNTAFIASETVSVVYSY